MERMEPNDRMSRNLSDRTETAKLVRKFIDIQ